VRLDPLREEAHRALIRLYAATGQTDLGRRQFEEVGKIFSERLGTAPSEQTRAALTAPESGRRSEASAPAEPDGPLGEGAPALFGIVTLVGTRLPVDNSGPLRERLLHSISSRGGREVRVNGDALLRLSAGRRMPAPAPFSGGSSPPASRWFW
jgi:hypothetical protein